MYAYIEVFDDGRIVLTFYAPCGGWREYEVIDMWTYASWTEVIAARWFDSDVCIPIHISPDLFSTAGMDNSE